MNPYFLTSILFLFLAGLVAVDSALTSFQILPWFNGLRWLRVHLITLGAVSEMIFGLLPALTAKAAAPVGLKKYPFRWDIWLALTLGLLILMVGIPQMNYAVIVTGGTLIFTAALLLVFALRGPTPGSDDSARQSKTGRFFYLAGLLFLLVGIIVGSGLWFGWGQALAIANPIEVHIHSNTWGFMSLVFAGLIVDLYPRWTGRALARPGSTRPIFWLMTFGAIGAVLGPWLAVNAVTALGIVIHQVATVWLLVNMIKPLRGMAIARTPGIWHVITAYVWQVAVVLGAPLIALFYPGFSPAAVEQTAPQVLIYGWMLQFGYAFIPYVLRKAAAPRKEATLGGSWISLAAVHLGGIFLLASILAPGLWTGDLSEPLLGAAYLLWFVSLLPIARQSWNILNSIIEPEQAALTSDPR